MAILTIKHSVARARSFIDEVSSANHAFYAFVGKGSPWPDDTHPPVSNNSVNEFEQSIYNDLLFGKRIASSDIALMVPRYNWVNNTAYAAYDENEPSMYSTKFFVVTPEKNVFKCIWNNGGTESTVKPTLITSSGVFSTSDGYVWKYMYTIDTLADTKFSSNNYIPVVANSDVSSNATPGSIDFIAVDVNGVGYETYRTGFLSSVVNSQIVVLESDASPYNDYYTNSSIYLSTGLGAAQIRDIVAYDGLNKRVRVSPSFDTYLNISLSNVQGNVVVGQTAEQPFEQIQYIYKSGFFTEGDTVIQSGTNAYGIIITANTNTFRVFKTSPANTSFSLTEPLYNSTQTGTLKTGTVTISNGSANIVGVGTSFNTEYAANSYVRVGSNANTNIRRIVTVTNSTFMIVDTAFSAYLAANVHYLIPNAFKADSITTARANGTVRYVNLNGIKMAYSNTSLGDLKYISGETVLMVDSGGVYQGANATVSFANASHLILSNVSGTFQSNLFVKGQSSLAVANISVIESFQNITIRRDQRDVLGGMPLVFRTDSNITGNAMVVSSFFIPTDLTQYVISPKVTIEGDGQGALAYSYVDTSNGSTMGVGKIEIIDNGNSYTWANVTVTANSLYGSGADVSARIAPVKGHGYDAGIELGAVYAAVYSKFDTAENELYKFPSSMAFRRLGIIKDPAFDDVYLDLSSTFDRQKLTISTVGTFTPSEVVLQPATNAAGVVVYSNTTFLELQYISGSFAKTGNTTILGLSSNTSGTVSNVNISHFTFSGTESIIQPSTGATADLTQILSNTVVRVSNVVGQMTTGSIYSPTTNAYGTVTGIRVANGTTNATASFGVRFNQTFRLTLATNTAPYTLYETIRQDATNASAMVLNTTTDVDFVYSVNSGSLSIGNQVHDLTTNASGVVIFANTTYVKLTGANGSFVQGHILSNSLGATGTIGQVYPVLICNGLVDMFQEGAQNITGETSQAVGTTVTANTLSFPDLTKHSGEVIYIDNSVPITKTLTTKEELNLVIKF